MSGRDIGAFGYSLAETAAAAAQGAPFHGRLLRELASVVGASAGIVTRRADGRAILEVLAVEGYDARLVRFMTSPRLLERDPAMQSIRRDASRAPIRTWHDRDYVYETSATVRNYLRPAGFRGGLSLRCFAERGRHVGDVHLSTRERCLPSDEQLDALGRSLATVRALIDSSAGRSGAAALGETGEIRFVDDPADPKDLGAIVSLVRVSVPRAARRPVLRWRSTRGAWYRIELSPGEAGVAATVRREPPPHGVTARELDVLRHLCSGARNSEIARALAISERTVAHHVENVLAKLGTSTRTAAVARALREGLVGEMPEDLPELTPQPETH
jgi:DNA-binding CsgD family transcriptional regulator